MPKVFCYMQLRECGCCCHVTSPETLPHAMKHKSFKKAMLAGEILTLYMREEYEAIPWKCDKMPSGRQARRHECYALLVTRKDGTDAIVLRL